MPECFKVVCTMQGAIQMLCFFLLYMHIFIKASLRLGLGLGLWIGMHFVMFFARWRPGIESNIARTINV